MLQSSCLQAISDKIEVKHLFIVQFTIYFIVNNFWFYLRIDQQKVDLSFDRHKFELDDLSSLDNNALSQ